MNSTFFNFIGEPPARTPSLLAQVSKPAGSRVSEPADRTQRPAPCRFGNRRHGRFGSLRHGAAFTLIEILVVVALLAVIVLGLLQMFTQTQKAFRTGLTQADVLEAGRITGDMLGRELQQITPTQLSNTVNFEAWYPNYRPLEQDLPGTTSNRVNMIEDLFFLTRGNRTWTGIGYFVRTAQQTPTRINVAVPAVNSADVGVSAPDILTAGTLYRFEATITNVLSRDPRVPGRVLTPDDLYALYRSYAYASTWPVTNALVARLVDGVVHFKVRAYNTNGLWITNDFGLHGVSTGTNQSNTDIRVSGRVPGEVGQYRFFSNAVPAAVELELGLLEDKAWERFKNQPTDLAKFGYLTNVVGRVHLFRHRVQVRNVDPIAYR